MSESGKAEVNLEISSGVFRIPTNDIIYNITVVEPEASSATKVVEKIIEVEKIVEVEKIIEVEKEVFVPMPQQEEALPVQELEPDPGEAPSPEPEPVPEPAQEAPPAATPDDYYQKAVVKFNDELLTIAKAIQPEGQNTGAVEDIADMAEDLMRVIKGMRDLPALSGDSPSSEGASSGLAEGLASIAQLIAKSKELCQGGSQESEAPPATEPGPAPAAETKTRYKFELDTVFQTIYELCTNETVKTHIQNARAEADANFDADKFNDDISPKVSSYDEDDGFLSVPMTDVYNSMQASCSDKKVQNLLKKMDKQQSEIFLDQYLPLEVPPTEEVAGDAPEPAAVEAGPAPQSTPAPDMTELSSLLDDCHSQIEALVEQAQSQEDGISAAPDLSSITNTLDDALNITGSIKFDAAQLAKGETDVAAFENAPWLNIKATSLSLETLLKQKEENPEINFEEGLAAADAAANDLRKSVIEEFKASLPEPESVAAEPPPDDDGGEASQDDIDRLLQEMG